MRLPLSYLLIATSLALFSESKETLSPFDCKNIQVSKSHIYDLSTISFPVKTSNIETTPPTDTRTTVQIDLCKPLEADPERSQADQCPRGTRICITVESIKGGKATVIQAIPVAYSGDGGGSKIDAKVEFGDTLDGGERAIKLDLPGGDYGGRSQKTELELVCDKAAKEDAVPTARRYDRQDGKLEMRWPTKFACSSASSRPDSKPSSSKEPEKDTSGSSSDGWGFFSWLFFLLFMGFAVYMGVGAYNNYNRYGSTGWDLVPHRDFWRESPYIAKDAASHAWGSMGGSGGFGGGGGRGAYEPL